MKKRKPKKPKSEAKKNLDSLAWALARKMTKRPRRYPANDKFIRGKKLGCFTFTDIIQYCDSSCFYLNCCSKVIQWRLSENGKLTPY